MKYHKPDLEILKMEDDVRTLEVASNDGEDIVDLANSLGLNDESL